MNLNQGYYNWSAGNVIIPGQVQSSYSIAPAGNYKVQICRENGECDMSDREFTLYGDNQTSRPVINGVDAPVSLSVNQMGTWRVRATDPMNGTLSYQVDWGDSVYPVSASGSVSSPTNYQSSTFTHSYTSPGTYTVAITVTNSTGMSARTTTTVQVTPVAYDSSLPDINIVSPNGGESWLPGSNQNITVRLSGDESRVGNLVNAFLENTSGQRITLIGMTALSPSNGVGARTFSVYVPYNLSGKYRLLVNLFAPSFNGQVQQAYDFSDNYITVGTSGLLQICPNQKIVNQMPSVGASLPSTYYILDNQRREVSEFDAGWVSSNCIIPTVTAY